MTEWQDPQTRAEAEDKERGYDALKVDGSADTRERSGNTVLVDGSQVFPLNELGHVDDTREKLEKEIREHFTYGTSTAMWPPSANKTTYHVSAGLDTVLGWLDRQESITDREWESEQAYLNAGYKEQIAELTEERDEQKRSAVKLQAELRDVKEHAERQRVRISELEMLHVGMKAQRDALQEKVDAMELRERCAPDYDFRQAAEMWEEAFEDKCAELFSLQEKVDELTAERDELRERMRIEREAVEACEGCDKVDSIQAELDKANESGDRLFNALIDTTAERDRLLEQLQRVWLKDADGDPLHIGETRYGEDGTEWRVTGFRWGSSHPVQGVDGKGRRRDLRPEWLRSEKPDSLGSLLEDVRRGALAYPRDRVAGYLEDNHSIGEAVLLDVRDRIEKLAGGSE